METTLGGVMIALYLVGLGVLWKVVERKGHPGLLRTNGAIEAAMIVHIAILLVGITLVLLGLHDEF